MSTPRDLQASDSIHPLGTSSSVKTYPDMPSIGHCGAVPKGEPFRVR